VKFGEETGHGHMLSMFMECLSVSKKICWWCGYLCYFRIILGWSY